MNIFFEKLATNIDKNVEDPCVSKFCIELSSWKIESISRFCDINLLKI